MNIRTISFVIAISSTLSCIDTIGPVNHSEQPKQGPISRIGHSFVYSINELNENDDGSIDSTLGVMVITVEKTDSIRNKQVYQWVNRTMYFTGSEYELDTVYTSHDYVLETDSFLTNVAYSNIGNAGVLMKRRIAEPTDSVFRNGDTVKIENELNTFFCKLPSVGFTWIQRPGWLGYSITDKTSISVWGKKYDCFKINGTALDAHSVTTDMGTYKHQSWVTPNAILKTELFISIPDPGCCIPNYYRIELIQEVDKDGEPPEPSSYKNRIIRRGWNLSTTVRRKRLPVL